MMRITWDAPALIAVRSLFGGEAAAAACRSGRRGTGRAAARTAFRAERLEPRMMLDAGMRARVPTLLAASDTGVSAADRVTADQTPTLTGSVQGAATHVRLVIDGRPGPLVPVVDGTWTHTVPAEAPLTAGRHAITVQPVDASGEAGRASRPLPVTVATQAPTAPTLLLGAQSDSGVRGDGRTTAASLVLRGIAQPGRQVRVSIDGLPLGPVWSDARTGAWVVRSPRLSSGGHQIEAVAADRAGLESPSATLAVTVAGMRTVMLDASGGKSVELTAAHLLGRGSQGFTVTRVHGGTLQKWSAATNSWLTIPAASSGDTATLWRRTTLPTVSFTDVIRWTPSPDARGIGAAFDVVPLDRAGGEAQPAPAEGTVPGRIVAPRVVPDDGVGTTISWQKPTDGCGCGSTRYSIEVTREDGQTLLYNLAGTVNKLAVVEGGRVERATMWAATKNGAGEAQAYDALVQQMAKNRVHYTAMSGLSVIDAGLEARAQIAASPTGVAGRQTSFVLGGTHADLAYVEVRALPDAVEAAQGLPAGSVPLVSSESNRLTALQRMELERLPILSRHLFPGTEDGLIQPDQMRVHFQAGETLRFAGSVAESVRDRATIVVEQAPILGDSSLGHWNPVARIPVGADGGFSHDHVVEYGMNSVRVRLEVASPAPAAIRSANVAASGSTTVPSTVISLDYNAFGITTPPWQVANHQGFDRSGNYYNSDYTGPSTANPVPGTPLVFNGLEFPIGPVPTDSRQVGGSSGPQNFVQAKGQSISVTVAADMSHYLYLAGAAANGNQLAQKIVLKFTDGTTETWSQSFTDWSNNGSTSIPKPFSGEWLLKTQPERINQEGNLEDTPAYIFAYGYNLHGKQLASITLPDNDNIGILSAVVAKSPTIAVGTVESFVLGQANLSGVDTMTLTIKNESNIGAGGGPLTFFFADQPVAGCDPSATVTCTYTTKQVTVPMGQQETITYIAPDDSSQMNFWVQKGDNTCVGATCSTYLTDWKSGTGSSDTWAANLNPSLNSQMKAGQHWTMTVQNAGFGYFGFLDSPAGQNLPSASGNTPGGARFQLMTQAEINSQPPWARVLEEELGEIIGLTILTIATGGLADAALGLDFVATEVVEQGVSDTVSTIAVDGGSFIESVSGDSLSESLLSDAESDVDEEDIFLNLDDDSRESVISRDSINDIFDKVDNRDSGKWRRVVIGGLMR